jgi:ubiquinol-cytochrome c reductase cytochrome b subunit
LHDVGSNNPDGVEIKKNKDKNGIPKDGIPFHPYYTVKDIFGVMIFGMLFAWVMFYSPEMYGYFLEYNNFIPADPLTTPAHIAPVWYFTPYYAILRAVPDKLGGVIAMGGAVGIFFLLPWLDRSPVKSIRYKAWPFKFALFLFTVSFIALGILGVLPAEGTYVLLARIFSGIYFGFFILMPFYSTWGTPKEVPERVTM